MKRFAVSVNNHTDPTIQAGKRYEVLNWEGMDLRDGRAFFDIDTVDRNGDPYSASCIAYGSCAYLDGEEWTIIEEEEPSNDN